MLVRAARTLIILAALAAGVYSSRVLAQGDKSRLSVWDGAYLDEQATRGKGEYDYNCSSCHINDLAGDSIKDVPPLAGDDFLVLWEGKSVKELLEYIRTNMPQDSKGSLDPKAYADIASYILQTNKFPAGKEALGSDDQKMSRTVIEKEKK
jgi:mono/diheme cytochrome c family protein